MKLENSVKRKHNNTYQRDASKSQPSAHKRERKGVKSRIISNPNLCGGEPIIKGTRIPVFVVLSHLASGDDDDTILENFPRLKKEDINACREFAAKHAVAQDGD